MRRTSSRDGRAPWRRPSEVLIATLAVFLLLAVTTDVLLAMRDPSSSLGGSPARPDRDGHRRALLLGDSLMDGAAPELTDLFDRNGVETRVEGAPATGPLTPQGFWREEMKTAVAEFDPDVVVIEACCNYDADRPHRLYGGTTVPPDSPEMYQQWELTMRELVSIAGSKGARVYVVNIPPPVPSGVFGSLGFRIDRLNRIYAALDVPVIDWAAALPAAERAADGLHLIDQGDQLVAEATWAAVAPAFEP